MESICDYWTTLQSNRVEILWAGGLQAAKNNNINPFGPELPVIAHADPGSFYCLLHHQL